MSVQSTASSTTLTTKKLRLIQTSQLYKIVNKSSFYRLQNRSRQRFSFYLISWVIFTVPNSLLQTSWPTMVPFWSLESHSRSTPSWPMNLRNGLFPPMPTSGVKYGSLSRRVLALTKAPLDSLNSPPSLLQLPALVQNPLDQIRIIFNRYRLFFDHSDFFFCFDIKYQTQWWEGGKRKLVNDDNLRPNKVSYNNAKLIAVV